jgi:hypothetical protein
MVAQTQASPSSASRKIRRLAIGVVIVAALYSTGWFYVASKFESFLNGFLTSAKARSLGARCDRLETGGFPFLIGFDCSATTLDDAESGNAFKTGPLRVVARIYNPGVGLTELDGPAHLALGDGSALDADWTSLRSSFKANLDGLQSVSMFGTAPSMKFDIAALLRTFAVKAKEAELHLRNNNGDLETAVMTRDLGWNEEGMAPLMPDLSASAQFTLIGMGKMLQGVTPPSKAMKGELQGLKIEMADGAYGEMSGPFTINDQGLMSATFTTRLEKLDLWRKTLRAVFPDAGDTISGMTTLLRGLAKGGDKVTVKLDVYDGLITLSMMPIGHIPAI